MRNDGSQLQVYPASNFEQKRASRRRFYRDRLKLLFSHGLIAAKCQYALSNRKCAECGSRRSPKNELRHEQVGTQRHWNCDDALSQDSTVNPFRQQHDKTQVGQIDQHIGSRKTEKPLYREITKYIPTRGNKIEYQSGQYSSQQRLPNLQLREYGDAVDQETKKSVDATCNQESHEGIVRRFQLGVAGLTPTAMVLPTLTLNFHRSKPSHLANRKAIAFKRPGIGDSLIQ